MLDKLDPYLLYEIYYFLSNYDIIENLYINKRLTNSINNIKFIENIIYRNHPLVYNIHNNYCDICNLGIYILDDNTSMINCQHTSKKNLFNNQEYE